MQVAGDFWLLVEHGLDLLGGSVVALICGFLLGYERQRRGKPVGILTASLVAIGSMAYVKAGTLIAAPDLPGDPGRIPSMIVSGIGFVGGGAILRSGFHVTGLASAATIWTLGALGITIGIGHPLLALVAAVFVAVALRTIPSLEHALFRQRFCLHATVQVDPEHVSSVVRRLQAQHVDVGESQIERSDEQALIHLNECGLESRRDILDEIAVAPGVVGVSDHTVGS